MAADNTGDKNRHALHRVAAKEWRGTALVRQKAVSRPSDSQQVWPVGSLLPLTAVLVTTITIEPLKSEAKRHL